jgi:hypothetical protein
VLPCRLRSSHPSSPSSEPGLPSTVMAGTLISWPSWASELSVCAADAAVPGRALQVHHRRGAEQPPVGEHSTHRRAFKRCRPPGQISHEWGRHSSTSWAGTVQ